MFFFFRETYPQKNKKVRDVLCYPPFCITNISLCFVGIMPSLTISCYLKGVIKTASSLL